MDKYLEFSLNCQVERLTNQGSLGGIDALLGCPLHLPSSKVEPSRTSLVTSCFLLVSLPCRIILTSAEHFFSR